MAKKKAKKKATKRKASKKKASKKKATQKKRPPSPRTRALNARQQRFVEEYLVDLCATQAAIRAGYSEKTAGVQAHKLLKIAEIATQISEAQEKRSRRVELTADDVLRELALLAISDVTHYEVDGVGNLTVKDGVPREALRAVSSIKWRSSTDQEGNTHVDTEIKLWNKPKALELTGKHLGMFEKGADDGKKKTFSFELTLKDDGPPPAVEGGDEDER